MKIKLTSESATKLQKENAKVLFGKTSDKVLTVLEMYSKEKLLTTSGIDLLLMALKSKNTVALEKYANSASGSKVIVAAKKLSTVKTFAAIIENIKQIKSSAALERLSSSDEQPVKDKEIHPTLTTVKPKTNSFDSPITKKTFTMSMASKLNARSDEVFKAINSGKKFRRKNFGYWTSKPFTGKLPFPVVVDVVGYDKESFMSLLLQKEKIAKKVTNRGFSPNRWTGKPNGASEFHLDGWVWPQGIKAYLRKGVPPSKEFYKFITGKTLPSLPY